MSCAICFNLDQSKILSSGNGLKTYQQLIAFGNIVGKGEIARYSMDTHFDASSTDIFLKHCRKSRNCS